MDIGARAVRCLQQGNPWTKKGSKDYFEVANQGNENKGLDPEDKNAEKN
jgi:hypothetical protein